MATYALGVNTDFPAKHYLVGGDFGAEGELHAHHYRLEVVIEGDRLDEHGFLVDIVRVKSELGRIADRYRNRTLNDFPELEGVNPGCEAFSRVVAESLRERFFNNGVDPPKGLSFLTVQVWESESAWGKCRLEIHSE